MSRQILFTKTVIRDMVNEILFHPGIETAWGIAGLLMDDGRVIVNVMIPPSEKDIDRKHGEVELGGESLKNAVRWLATNWRLSQERSPVRVTGKFSFLHKGHSHHSLGIRNYSEEDNKAIREAVSVDGLEIAIGVLATIESSKMIAASQPANPASLLIDRHQDVLLQFYYLDKEMVAGGQDKPILVMPVVVDAKSVPALPPLGWQFTREAEFERQIRLLKDYGCSVSVVNGFDIPQQPPLEIRFVVSHPNWKGLLIIATAWNYPDTEPKVRIIPLPVKETSVDKSVIPKDSKGEQLWQKGGSLLDIARQFEAKEEL